MYSSLSQSCSWWKCGMFYVYTVCWVAGYKVWKCPAISLNTRLTSEWRNIGRCQYPGTPHRGHVREAVTLSTSRPGDQEKVRTLLIIPNLKPWMWDTCCSSYWQKSHSLKNKLESTDRTDYLSLRQWSRVSIALDTKYYWRKAKCLRSMFS